MATSWFCQSPAFSPSIITQQKESKQSCAFSPKWKCQSQEFQKLEISSFVFISYLHKSQNRIPLKGRSPTMRFKRRTNNFLTWVLRFRFQWKCRVNQMWKYRRVMNISLRSTDQATFRVRGEAAQTEYGECAPAKESQCCYDFYIFN